MAPGIFPCATWSLRNSSIRESFSSDNGAFGGGPKVDAESWRGGKTSIVTSRATYQLNDAVLSRHISAPLPAMWTTQIYDITADRATTSLRAKRSNPCDHEANIDCFVASLLAMTVESDHEYGLIRFCCSPLWCTSMSMKVRTFAER